MKVNGSMYNSINGMIYGSKKYLGLERIYEHNDMEVESRDQKTMIWIFKEPFLWNNMIQHTLGCS